MKHLHLILLSLIASILIGCGAGHPNLTSVTVSPSKATASSTPPSDVGYTATGKFADNSSRELNVADGLTWKTSDTAIATINDVGSATCKAPGSVTITATAPENLQITVNNGVNNTSNNVSGTATLNCT
jgi:hypothetical protein